jgi:predicted DNA-binding transcriptional regulator AlpA
VNTDSQTTDRMGTKAPDPLPGRKEVARYLGMSVDGLAQLHYRGEGPPSIVIGKRTVRYEWDDVIAWARAKRRSRNDA